jgi:hypothetical protein
MEAAGEHRYHSTFLGWAHETVGCTCPQNNYWGTATGRRRQVLGSYYIVDRLSLKTEHLLLAQLPSVFSVMSAFYRTQ